MFSPVEHMRYASVDSDAGELLCGTTANQSKPAIRSQGFTALVEIR
jgi:hypothetical protein